MLTFIPFTASIALIAHLHCMSIISSDEDDALNRLRLYHVPTIVKNKKKKHYNGFYKWTFINNRLLTLRVLSNLPDDVEKQ